MSSKSSPFVRQSVFSIMEFFPHCLVRDILDVLADRDKSKCLVALYYELTRLRNVLGKPLIINSGYRTQKHNEEVGGAKNSQHCLMQAVDVRINDDSEGLEGLMFNLRTYSEFLSFGQIIAYPKQKFVHLALPCAKYPSPTFYIDNQNGSLMRCYNKNDFKL